MKALVLWYDRTADLEPPSINIQTLKYLYMCFDSLKNQLEFRYKDLVQAEDFSVILRPEESSLETIDYNPMRT